MCAPQLRKEQGTYRRAETQHRIIFDFPTFEAFSLLFSSVTLRILLFFFREAAAPKREIAMQSHPRSCEEGLTSQRRRVAYTVAQRSDDADYMRAREEDVYFFYMCLCVRRNPGVTNLIPLIFALALRWVVATIPPQVLGERG